MPDPLRRYEKPALNEAELLSRWEERGLVVADAARATRYLRHLGYYRFSAYVRSFEGDVHDVLRAGTTFDDVLNLYIFDRKLRLLLLDAIERIEVALRATISDHMSRLAGTHWYEDARHFKNQFTHTKLLEEVDRMVEQQRRRRPEPVSGTDVFASALEHYVTHYDEPLRPPTWVVFEELSLGTVRSVYDALRDTSVQASIARTLGLNPPLLSSWLKSYQRVRNICAHHGRLWNRGLGVYPAIPRSRAVRWLDVASAFARDPWRRQRLFPVLVSLQTILHTISPGSTWSARLNSLFVEHPNVPLSGMGIPAGWFDDLFWSRRPHID